MKVVFPEPAMPTQTMATGELEFEAVELSGPWAEAMLVMFGALAWS